MTNFRNLKLRAFAVHLMTFFLLGVIAFWIKKTGLGSDWQQAGVTTFTLGFILLASHIAAQVLGTANLPLISGYIFVGIMAGPHVTEFLSEAMVNRLRLVDDLALSFIALTAGGTLHMDFLRRRSKAIITNISLLTLVVFLLVFISFFFVNRYLNLLPNLSWHQVTALGCLLGVIAVARSPSSAIAIISECRATGLFTSTVLGVTVAMDVLIIILFTLAITVVETILIPGSVIDYQTFMVLCLAVAGSLVLGGLLGKGIAFYVEKVGHDLPLLLLFFAFGMFEVSEWLNHFMEVHFEMSMVLEPLLICIGTGFTVQNFSKVGHIFMDNLERMALPIYVLFFSLAGASLNLKALCIAWPLAMVLVMARGIGIFGATWLAGVINRDPPIHRRIAWMAYLTQAGVAIGLAQLAQRRFPEIGSYLTTLVLAVITVNQIVGPISFKTALIMAGEEGGKRVQKAEEV